MLLEGEGNLILVKSNALDSQCSISDLESFENCSVISESSLHKEKGGNGQQNPCQGKLNSLILANPGNFVCSSCQFLDSEDTMIVIVAYFLRNFPSFSEELYVCQVSFTYESHKPSKKHKEH